MMVIKEFVLGGVISVIVQVIFRLTKLSVRNLMTVCLCFGGIITAAGLIEPIVGWGQSGIILMIIDSGEAIFRWTLSLIAGDDSPCLKYLGLLLFSCALGIIGGICYHKRCRSSN